MGDSMSFVTPDWHAAMQDVSAEIDQRFGERLRIVPAHTVPNQSPTYYPAEAIEILGVFRWPTKDVNLRMEEMKVVSRDPTATFSRTNLPWAIKRGDQITRCCDGSMFEVTAVRPDGVSRIECDLLQLGIPHQ